MSIQTNAVLHTDGKGYWSNIAQAVELESINVPYTNDDEDFGELCVYFNAEQWVVERDGLIYTDKQFLRELKDLLASFGLDASDVDYSEQGMQEVDYVSLDVGPNFLHSWKSLFPDLDYTNP